MTTKEHPNADILRAIADGKKINNGSGERVTPQYALSLILQNCADHLTIAPGTITVNWREVPAPYRGPMSEGQKYWVVDPTIRDYVLRATWNDDHTDRMWMERGMIHLDESAAAAHGRALVAASAQEGGAA